MILCVLLGLLVSCVLANGQTCDEALASFTTTNSECQMAFMAAAAFTSLGNDSAMFTPSQVELLCANQTCINAYTQFVAACPSNNSVSPVQFLYEIDVCGEDICVTLEVWVG